MPCKFFKVGNCQAGSACPFSHMSPDSSEQQPCKFFAKVRQSTSAIKKRDLISDRETASSAQSAQILTYYLMGVTRERFEDHTAEAMVIQIIQMATPMVASRLASTRCRHWVPNNHKAHTRARSQSKRSTFHNNNKCARSSHHSTNQHT